MKKNIKFKIILIFILFLTIAILLKALDSFLLINYGLGKPLIYKQSSIFNYNIKENQKLIRRSNEININSLGMRSKELTNNDSYKILFFGDSVTYGGSVVSNQELFSELTCKTLELNIDKKFFCGNYGVNGYSLYLITKKIKFNESIKEDFIVVTIIGNNLLRGDHHIKSQPFWSQNINNFLPALTELFFIYFDRFRENFKYDKFNEPINYKYIEYSINELSKTLEDKKIPYIVLYSPEKNELKLNPEKYANIKLLFQKKIKNFYDLTGDIRKEKNFENFYVDDIHLNSLGHQKYSEILSKIIKPYLN